MQQQPNHESKRSMAETLDALVASDGTGSHSYILSGRLLNDRQVQRNLADVAHYLCVLHGRHPGVMDHAALKITDTPARQWLTEAADAFVQERSYLAKLAVAAGPIPSTVGQAQFEAAIAAQRHALETLAQSERNGCALAAAIALSLDWLTMRAILDSAADRLDLIPPPCLLPDVRKTAELVNSFAQTEAIERAMTFGAQQVLSQHRGLWDILSAREEARRAS